MTRAVAREGEASSGPERRLGLLDATALVAGSMIGSGIFIVSADIARRLPAPGWLLAVWTLAGLLTVAGARSYGALAAAMPHAGGQYAYLAELYGPLAGFLFGWTLVLVIQTGTIAAVAVAFAKFAGVFLPDLSPRAVAVGVILLLTAINARGLEGGRRVQNAFTATKVLTLLGVIALGLAFGDSGARAANLAADPFALDVGLVDALPLVAAAMVGALFSSTAWPNVTFTAAETRDPRRTVGRALVLGTTLVCTLYVATNVAYLNVLPLTGNPDGGDVAARGIQHATADRVGTAVVERIAGGGWGPRLMALAVMVSTFGCANGLVLAGARVAWAMAGDGFFPAAVRRLNVHRVPGIALWLQGVWASLLALSGRYGDLLDYVVIAELLFYLLAVGGLFVLARRSGAAPRGVAYPWLQIAYIAAVAVLIGALLISKPAYTWGSVAVVLSGLPVYFLVRRRRVTA
jgi:basic amino acid/polyamine antiporter, APA family